jgi:hypothetical protein
MVMKKLVDLKYIRLITFTIIFLGTIFLDVSDITNAESGMALTQGIATSYTKEDQARNIVNTLYGDLNTQIEDVIEILSMNPDSNSVVWTTIQNVSEALVPIGFTIASAFILLSFLNKAMLFQLRSYEDIAKILLFMLLAKVVLVSSFEIMGFIYSATANIIQSAGVTPSQIMSDVNKETMITNIANMNALEMLSFEISIMPIMTIMSIMTILIKAVAYGRIFEIYIFTAAAPLPLSTLASPDQYSIAKKFIQAYVGVCLQGFIMILACVIFTALSVELIDPTLQDSPTGSGTGFLLAAVVLLFVLVKSGSWGKQLAGLI